MDVYCDMIIKNIFNVIIVFFLIHNVQFACILSFTY